MRKFTLFFALFLAVASTAFAHVDNASGNIDTRALSALALDIQPPVFSSKSGVYTQPVRVSLSSESALLDGVTRARYYYTTDGSEPTTSSAQAYSGTVPDVRTSCTVKAILYIVYNGEEYISAVSSETYIVSELLPYKKHEEKPLAGSYIFVADSQVASPIAEGENALAAAPVEVVGKYVETAAYYALTVSGAQQEGGYYIVDANENYLCVDAAGVLASADEVADATQWQCVEQADGGYVFAAAGFGLFYNPASGRFEAMNINALPADAVVPAYYAQSEYPSMEISPSAQDEIKEINDIIVTCSAGINFDEEAGIVTLLDPTSGEWNDNIGDYVYSSYYELYAESIDDNTVRLYFDETITEPGEYQLTIPAEFFVLDPSGLAIKNEAMGVNYTIAAPEIEFAIASATPAEGLVTSLKRIELVFTADCGEAYRTVNVLNADGEVVATATPTLQDENGAWYSDFNVMAYVLDTEITTPGVYTMEIPANAIPSTKFDSSWMPIYMAATTLKWAIGEENMTGIGGIQVEDAPAVIYDITGRRIEKITAPGLYIVNGKKVLVK